MCLTDGREFNPYEHRSAQSRLFLWASSRYNQITKSLITILQSLKLTRKPTILTIKTKTTMKMIQPYKRARIIEAETMSWQ
jgi:hypothetical protein